MRTPFEESNVYTQMKRTRFYLNVDFLFFVVFSLKKKSTTTELKAFKR